MSTYNTQNYMAHGGNELVIGGKLTVLEGATVTGIANAKQIVAATASTLGCIKAAAKGNGDTVEAKIGTDSKIYVPTYPQAANQADSTAATVAALKDDLNALLTKLKAAGLMVADAADGD